MKSTTAVQKSGWIVWWITTVVLALTAIIGLLGVFSIPDYRFGQNDKAVIIIVIAVMLFFFILEQVLAFFMIKYLHRDNSYIYPSILIVLGFLGSSLYFIPGIWGVLYTNHLKLNK